MLSETDTDSNEYFMGMAIAGLNNGMCQIWNPADSGVILYIRRLYAGLSNNSGMLGADIRKINSAIGSEYKADGIYKTTTNFNVASSVQSKAQMRADNGTIANKPPYHEIWVGQNQNDHPYEFNPPLRVDPGWGLYVTSASTSGQMIATWHWHEKPIA